MSVLKDLYNIISGKEKRQLERELQEKKRESLEKKRKSLEVEDELNCLLGELITDWNKYPSRTKIESVKGGATFNFKDGRRWILLEEEQGMLKCYSSVGNLTVTYRLSHQVKHDFITSFNKIITHQSKASLVTEKPSRDRTEKERKLEETIELRREHLKRLSKNHPEYKTLFTELGVAETKLNNLKKK